MTLRTSALAGVFMLIAAAAHADAVSDGIKASNAQFAAAAAKGDAAGVTALYTDDALLMPAGSGNIAGAAGILKFWQGALASGVGGVVLKTVEVYGHGATATEVGEYSMSDKSGKELDHGKYIVVWRRLAGHWKLHRDMFSTSVAAKPAK
jgi:uncharacterized protein (TIGR02246 family)